MRLCFPQCTAAVSASFSEVNPRTTLSLNTHLQTLQPLLQRLQGFARLFWREGAVLAVWSSLPALGVQPVDAVGMVVVAAVVRRRRVVWRGRSVVAAVVAVMVIGVAVVMAAVMGAVVVVVVAVVMTGAMVTAEALAQRELGGQLPDRFPLVQDGLLLPHEALAQMQDGGLGLVGHHAPPVAAIVAVAIAAWSMGHTGWGVAAWVCFWGNWSADELGANAIVIFYARQCAGCCSTRQQVVENERT